MVQRLMVRQAMLARLAQARSDQPRLGVAGPKPSYAGWRASFFSTGWVWLGQARPDRPGQASLAGLGQAGKLDQPCQARRTRLGWLGCMGWVGPIFCVWRATSF